MRPGSIAIVGGISVVVIMAITVLLFWFAAPRWQPELVMRYSPSLWHVIKALTYYENSKSSRSFSISATGTVSFLYEDESNSLQRFGLPYGDNFYAMLAAMDDGTDPQFANVIVYYLGDYAHNREARKVLWQYRDKGSLQARDILYREASNHPQGISPERIENLNRR